MRKLMKFSVIAFVLIVVHDLLKRGAVLLSSFFSFGDIGSYILRNIIFFSSLFLISALLIKIVLKIRLSEAGFNLKNRDQSLKVLKIFLSVWAGIVVTVVISGFKFIQGFENYILEWSQPSLAWELAKQLEVSALAGIAEETMYRAFVVSFLMKEWKGNIKVSKLLIPHAVILAALIFMTIHVDYTIYPFAINHIDYLQLVYTFVLGIIWGTVFVRTKSLLFPILAHSGSNFILSIAGFVASFII